MKGQRKQTIQYITANRRWVRKMKVREAKDEDKRKAKGDRD